MKRVRLTNSELFHLFETMSGHVEGGSENLNDYKTRRKLAQMMVQRGIGYASGLEKRVAGDEIPTQKELSG